MFVEQQVASSAAAAAPVDCAITNNGTSFGAIGGARSFVNRASGEPLSRLGARWSSEEQPNSNHPRNGRHRRVGSFVETDAYQRESEHILPRERIVAVGLLTQREVELLGHGFSRLWPVDESPCFSDLLQRIDEADRELRRDANRGEGASSGTGRRKADASAVPGGGRY